MEYCCREWHSAHLPVAFTNSTLGWSVSTRGRARCTRNAPRISANAMTIAMNTERKDKGTSSFLATSALHTRHAQSAAVNNATFVYSKETESSYGDPRHKISRALRLSRQFLP